MRTTQTSGAIINILNRTFCDLNDPDIKAIEKSSFHYIRGHGGTLTWIDLLQSERVLIISEAGTGKTYECQTQQKHLWQSGEAAFFIELSTLAATPLRDMLSSEEEQRLDAWLRAQSDIATFFLDSIDEINLTPNTFKQSLKKLSKEFAGHLGRARFVITTRPIPLDLNLVAEHLPVSEPSEIEPTAEAFADVMVHGPAKKPSKEPDAKKLRCVSLIPLTEQQIREFAATHGVRDADALLADIKERDALEFAERPQDLIEICADWAKHHRIRLHREQVETNIQTKLQPSRGRREKAELSVEDAIDGASRLALAALLVRKLTLKYSTDKDDIAATVSALDVSKILQGWTDAQQRTLLERPLFGVSSYGRVRFHHRSVIEYLAAKRLNALIERGVAIKAVKRLLFADTAHGIRMTRPSLRPVTAWLASFRPAIFDEVVKVDPSVVLDYGDPQSLSVAQRAQALEAYVARYGHGSWRGLNTPTIQVYRFSDQQLDVCVAALWSRNIENPEMRELLLNLAVAGKLRGSADIAHAIATDVIKAPHERFLAIRVLVAVADPRLEELSNSVARDPVLWPDRAASNAIYALFPAHISERNLSQTIRRVRDSAGAIGVFDYYLPEAMRHGQISPEYLDAFRQSLTDIILDGAEWNRDAHPHLRTPRPDLVACLLAACIRQAQIGTKSEEWSRASLLTIRLSSAGHREQETISELRAVLASLSAAERERAILADHAFLLSLQPHQDPFHRAIQLFNYEGTKLIEDCDKHWVRQRLSDSSETTERREMFLWVEMLFFGQARNDIAEYYIELKACVADVELLVQIVEARLNPSAGSARMRQLQADDAKRTEQAKRRNAKVLGSWIQFWREVANKPDAVFAPDRADNTAWNLWLSLERSGRESRAAGWNRRFIESQFGKPVADRLRQTMMTAWRKDKPTLRSERPEGEKGTFLVKWQFGLAGIAAEAEDPCWIDQLTEAEAELACRYAPIEVGGFPFWLEALASKFPTIVDSTIGNELTISLSEISPEGAHSSFLQDVEQSSSGVAALFVPRVREWIGEAVRAGCAANSPVSEGNLRRAIKILALRGNGEDRRFLEVAAQRYLAEDIPVRAARIWLPALLNLNPQAGVDSLGLFLSRHTPSARGPAVEMLADLFDHHYSGLSADLGSPGFTPSLLLCLLRLCYQHVRDKDNAHHEGSYSPDVRDNAEKTRSAVFGALMDAKGPEAWTAKLELAADPLFADLKDRIVILAEEKAAEEADNVVLTEAEFVVLDGTGEAPPTTNDAMFALMCDRLDDLDDLLLRDDSPRAAWAGIDDEHVMRRELARELRHAAHQNYTVDQEAVTADEKETDIRMRSTGADIQAAIELKLGDGRPFRDLFDTIADQLLKKYLAPENCRAGCLLVTLSHDRKWEHPETGELIDFKALINILNEEALRLSRELGGAVKMMAKGLDLRPRLTTERKKRKADSTLPIGSSVA